MDGPEGLFWQDKYFISYVSLCACKTSIPYSQNGSMREQYYVYIISSGKYIDNLNNIPTDLNIF